MEVARKLVYHLVIDVGRGPRKRTEGNIRKYTDGKSEGFLGVMRKLCLVVQVEMLWALGRLGGL